MDAYCRLLIKDACGCHMEGNQRDSNDDYECENGPHATLWPITERTGVTHSLLTPTSFRFRLVRPESI